MAFSISSSHSIIAQASSALMLGLILSSPAHAAESDALEVFSAGLGGALTFTSQRAADDISLAFMHFTKSGRADLIDELQKTGVVSQALARRASIKAFTPTNRFIASRRVGANGVDEYDMRGDFEFQWQTCETNPCVPTGPRKKVAATGIVVQVMAYGRPAYKISSLRIAEASK